MKKPNWKITFRNLPEIPDSKRWIKNGRFTPEISIVEKLRLGLEISKDEADTIRELNTFYKALDLELESLTPVAAASASASFFIFKTMRSIWGPDAGGKSV